MNLGYDLYHISCYSAYAVVIRPSCHIAISSELFRNNSVYYRVIKDRQAIVAIVKVFWSLLSVKALKLGPQKLQLDRRLCSTVFMRKSQRAPKINF